MPSARSQASGLVLSASTKACHSAYRSDDEAISNSGLDSAEKTTLMRDEWTLCSTVWHSLASKRRFRERLTALCEISKHVVAGHDACFIARHWRRSWENDWRREAFSRLPLPKITSPRACASYSVLRSRVGLGRIGGCMCLMFRGRRRARWGIRWG